MLDIFQQALIITKYWFEVSKLQTAQLIDFQALTQILDFYSTTKAHRVRMSLTSNQYLKHFLVSPKYLWYFLKINITSYFLVTLLVAALDPPNLIL